MNFNFVFLPRPSANRSRFSIVHLENSKQHPSMDGTSGFFPTLSTSSCWSFSRDIKLLRIRTPKLAKILLYTNFQMLQRPFSSKQHGCRQKTHSFLIWWKIQFHRFLFGSWTIRRWALLALFVGRSCCTWYFFDAFIFSFFNVDEQLWDSRLAPMGSRLFPELTD